MKALGKGNFINEMSKYGERQLEQSPQNTLDYKLIAATMPMFEK